MAAFMKGDWVAVMDPVLPFCIKSGRISDIQFTSTNDLFYKIDIDHTDRTYNSVWADERSIIRLMKPEQELWKFFIYQNRPIVAYTMAEEFEGEECDTMMHIANDKSFMIFTASSASIITLSLTRTRAMNAWRNRITWTATNL